MLTLMLALLVSNVHAGNYVPVTKTHTKTYWEKAICEAQEGSGCIDATTCPLDECSFVTASRHSALVRDATKIAAKKEAQILAARASEERKERRARIVEGCAKAEGLLKDLCDDMVERVK